MVSPILRLRCLYSGSGSTSFLKRTFTRNLCAEHGTPVRSEVDKLIDAVLVHVHEHGWTEKTLEAAVSDLGWSPAAKSILPRGPVNVVEALIARLNREFALHLQHDMDQHPVNDNDLFDDRTKRAQYAIRNRIEMIKPWKKTWAQALALQALPPNLSNAATASRELSDEIAHYAGFRATDMSWYSDRFVLGCAFHATELFWLNDRSLDDVETWRFLERGLEKSLSLRNSTAVFAEKVATLADAATATMRTLIRTSR